MRWGKTSTTELYTRAPQPTIPTHSQAHELARTTRTLFLPAGCPRPTLAGGREGGRGGESIEQGSPEHQDNRLLVLAHPVLGQLVPHGRRVLVALLVHRVAHLRVPAAGTHDEINKARVRPRPAIEPARRDRLHQEYFPCYSSPPPSLLSDTEGHRRQLAKRDPPGALGSPARPHRGFRSLVYLFFHGCARWTKCSTPRMEERFTSVLHHRKAVSLLQHRVEPHPS